MASFVTGGKTWFIPTPDITTAHSTPPTGSPVPAQSTMAAAPPRPSVFTEFLTGMTVIYIVYAITAVAAMLGMIAMFALAPPQLQIASNGGIIIPTPEPTGFPFRAAVLLFILPVAIYFLMENIGQTRLFDGATGKRNTICALVLIVLTLAASSIVVSHDLKWASSIETSIYSTDLKEWMQTRYGFEPYRAPEFHQIVEGEKLYSNDATFPTHDVYLKQADDAYLLLDAQGNELPIKN